MIDFPSDAIVLDFIQQKASELDHLIGPVRAELQEKIGGLDLGDDSLESKLDAAVQSLAIRYATEMRFGRLFVLASLVDLILADQTTQVYLDDAGRGGQ